MNHLSYSISSGEYKDNEYNLVELKAITSFGLKPTFKFKINKFISGLVKKNIVTIDRCHNKFPSIFMTNFL